MIMVLSTKASIDWAVAPNQDGTYFIHINTKYINDGHCEDNKYLINLE